MSKDDDRDENTIEDKSDTDLEVNSNESESFESEEGKKENILFAGDWCSEKYNGYVTGAFENGEYVGRQIIMNI